MSIENVIFFEVEADESFGGDPVRGRSWSVTLFRRWTFGIHASWSVRKGRA